MNHNELDRMTSGRRLIHLCLFGWLCMHVFHLSSTLLLLPMLLALSGMAVIGSARVARALGLSRAVSVASSLGAALPLAGLFVMGWLSSRARRKLLTAGWRLGMFHAYRPAQGGMSMGARGDPMV
jgi:hypothetical protein